MTRGYGCVGPAGQGFQQGRIVALAARACHGAGVDDDWVPLEVLNEVFSAACRVGLP